MNDVQVRRATDADAPAVAALRHRWTEEQAGAQLDDPGFPERFDAWWRRESDQRLTWLAFTGGRPVGMLNMLVFTRMPKPADPARRTPRRTQWGYVANVYVDRRSRGAGTGGRLVEECVAHARAHRFDRLVLSPSERSVPLYARAGFVPATSLMVLPLS